MPKHTTIWPQVEQELSGLLGEDVAVGEQQWLSFGIARQVKTERGASAFVGVEDFTKGWNGGAESSKHVLQDLAQKLGKPPLDKLH